MLLATSRWAMPSSRGALAVDVDLERRVVEHLRDAGIDHAGDPFEHVSRMRWAEA